ncbi:hypothetical protein GXM_07646 [Nostoc sphaeroides CCNUC1]|uniref:Uncharacterized protein n=1 Tax=Nostoc sphaeroides CCNUC1 TaxID=2653204 RepID=A0A5P8WC76_9NOSO|nr:hypothetical protein GXM_07646 [Nostoc sphaeroides CCNUC1]
MGFGSMRLIGSSNQHLRFLLAIARRNGKTRVTTPYPFL